MKKTFAEGRVSIARCFAISLPLMLAFGQGAKLSAETIIFSDDFTGPLNAAWQVLPGQGSYSVAGGQLRYYNEGPQSSPSVWVTTSLSLAFPFTGTNWEIDTKAAFSLDWCTSGNSYTGPSVPTPSCSSGAQRPQVIVSFDPVTASDRSSLAGNNYADFDRGTDAYYGDNHLTASYGATSVSGLLNPADAGIVNNIADGSYWYQFIRDGGTLTMNYSYDGVHYVTALSTQLANPSSSFNELLLTGTTYETAGSFTDYDYVRITSAVPEPSSAVPLALCFVAVGLNWFSRFFGGPFRWGSAIKPERQKEFLDLKSAAHVLDKAERAANAMVTDGRAADLKVGGRWLVHLPTTLTPSSSARPYGAHVRISAARSILPELLKLLGLLELDWFAISAVGTISEQRINHLMSGLFVRRSAEHVDSIWAEWRSCSRIV